MENIETYKLSEPKLTKIMEKKKTKKKIEKLGKSKFLDENLDKDFLKNYFTVINLKVKKS